MKTSLAWMLAAGALSVAASSALAGAPDAQQQAMADTAKSATAAERPDQQAGRREVRIYRMGRPDFAMGAGADRAGQLTTLLQLRPEQEGALKTFLDATGPTDGGHMMRFEHGGQTMTTPERLAGMEAHLEQQQAAMRSRIAATRTFYAKLDARQQKVFDALPMLMMPGPGPGPMVMPVRNWRPGDVRRPDFARDQKPRT